MNRWTLEQMAVDACHASAMIDLDAVAEAATPAGFEHLARACGINLRSGIIRDVQAIVEHTPGFASPTKRRRNHSKRWPNPTRRRRREVVRFVKREQRCVRKAQEIRPYPTIHTSASINFDPGYVPREQLQVLAGIKTPQARIFAPRPSAQRSFRFLYRSSNHCGHLCDPNHAAMLREIFFRVGLLAAGNENFSPHRQRLIGMQPIWRKQHYRLRLRLEARRNRFQRLAWFDHMWYAGHTWDP